MSYEGVTREKFFTIFPNLEIQKLSHTCWAASFSVLMRLNGVQVSEQAVINFYPEWVFEGITFDQLESIAVFYNRFYFSKESGLLHGVREIKVYEELEPILQYADQYSGFLVFVEGHYVVVLGCDDDQGTIDYYDPWVGVIETCGLQYFFNWGTQQTLVISGI
ncbi:papain-like cysteine protease family protein [Pseudomonas fluorescens]|uniref:papain-like cysteine protease family protein n=1 Tax=Pseudomonas fluorescens TaxID=294 RepID=UPI0007D0B374|nr:papain-like cysteine protease family protein [Pseudomonas fluorescens]